MALHALDWLIVASYVIFALAVGVYYSKRASRDVDEFFLSGRTLPWWIAGTSMVATSFAADTPLVISGWVRDFGIWKNWLWWCYCGGGMLAVFLFARGWRRGGVMTKAELSELRYGGPAAAWLRAILGGLHAGITNTMVLCWVLLAARKTMEVLLEIDPNLALVIGCVIALGYSLMAGFWGVVMTDFVQFIMAMVGAVSLAWLSWSAVGGSEGILEAAKAGAPFTENTLRFFPVPGEGTVFDASFWTTPVAALAVYLGIAWWAAENVDGTGTTVQRIAASRNERDGVLAVMWFNVAHYALRPWPWIMVGLASLLVLPKLTVMAPMAGTVEEVAAQHITLRTPAGTLEEVSFTLPGTADDWKAEAKVKEGQAVEAGDLLARSDSERAYVVMMRRFLPVGLLGLVVASLLAAFMSTIDTHVNLASSFFVNDIYRRFFKPQASSHHYIQVARIASVVVLGMAGLLASASDSISDLFLFFMTFLSGVGPIYVLRWHWWRIRAGTEITAMLSSASATIALTTMNISWADTPLSPGGVLAPEGRMVIVVAISSLCALLVTVFGKKQDPRELLPFYRKVRPAGWWGPVAVLAPEVLPRREGGMILTGILGGLGLCYGLMLAMGYYLVEQVQSASFCLLAAVLGAFALNRALKSTDERESEPTG
ncbi:MAG: SSS family solute:Na+ symporter [Candidatus Paceibacteria bacterium]|jgi:SSS family solute:Na+ symporter